MSSSRAFCLPSVKKQKHDFFPVQCIIKQLLDSVFVISRIIEVSVRVISLSLRLRLLTPTSTSIIQKPHPIIVYYSMCYFIIPELVDATQLSPPEVMTYQGSVSKKRKSILNCDPCGTVIVQTQ